MQRQEIVNAPPACTIFDGMCRALKNVLVSNKAKRRSANFYHPQILKYYENHNQRERK
jgi:hypothetical protein